jgi:hypothetical protein
MLRRALFAMIAFLSACQGMDGDPMLRPVGGSDAPTVGGLFASGYRIVDERGVGFDCGPGCIGDGFDAVYLGTGETENGEELAHYACPGIRGAELKDWRCRRLPHPYVPNGGFRR